MKERLGAAEERLYVSTPEEIIPGKAVDKESLIFQLQYSSGRHTDPETNIGNCNVTHVALSSTQPSSTDWCEPGMVNCDWLIPLCI